MVHLPSIEYPPVMINGQKYYVPSAALLTLSKNQVPQAKLKLVPEKRPIERPEFANVFLDQIQRIVIGQQASAIKEEMSAYPNFTIHENICLTGEITQNKDGQFIFANDVQVHPRAYLAGVPISSGGKENMLYVLIESQKVRLVIDERGKLMNPRIAPIPLRMADLIQKLKDTHDSEVKDVSYGQGTNRAIILPRMENGFNYFISNQLEDLFGVNEIRL
jgi:hypothetical protein